MNADAHEALVALIKLLAVAHVRRERERQGQGGTTPPAAKPTKDETVDKNGRGDRAA